MKKINHIADLYLEQNKLLEKEFALEKEIKYDWNSIKGGIKPPSTGTGIITRIAGQILKNKRQPTGLLISGLGYVAGFLTKKLLQRKVHGKFRNLTQGEKPGPPRWSGFSLNNINIHWRL